MIFFFCQKNTSSYLYKLVHGLLDEQLFITCYIHYTEIRFMSSENLSYCVILPVTNETISLTNTIEIILNNNKEFIKEIIIVSSAIITTKQSLDVITILLKKYKKIIRHHIQKKPFIGGAIEEAFNLSSLHIQL